MLTKQKLILLIAIIALVGLVVIAVVIRKGGAPELNEGISNEQFNEQFGNATPRAQDPQEVGGNGEKRQAPSLAAPLDEAARLRIDLEGQASRFAEGWGSYWSGQSISSAATLFPLMTGSMRAYTTANPPEKDKAGVGFAVTTRALSAHRYAVDLGTGISSVTITTQRTEMSGQTITRIFYQDIEIKFKKEAEVWRVDGVFWADEINKPQP